MLTLSAFDDEGGLDMLPWTWDMLGMHRGERHGRATRQRSSGARAGRIVPVLLALLAASIASSLACRHAQEQAGAGGQSGDEGRRPATTWLGTGGVTATSDR
jgi:hypothetical protein